MTTKEARGRTYTVEVYTGGHRVKQVDVVATCHDDALSIVVNAEADLIAGGPIESFPVRPPPYPEDAVQVHFTAWKADAGFEDELGYQTDSDRRAYGPDLWADRIDGFEEGG